MSEFTVNVHAHNMRSDEQKLMELPLDSLRGYLERAEKNYQEDPKGGHNYYWMQTAKSALKKRLNSMIAGWEEYLKICQRDHVETTIGIIKGLKEGMPVL